MTPYFESVVGYDPDGIRRICAAWFEVRDSTSDSALRRRHSLHGALSLGARRTQNDSGACQKGKPRRACVTTGFRPLYRGT
jgi:hypothetical protein